SYALDSAQSAVPGGLSVGNFAGGRRKRAPVRLRPPPPRGGRRPLPPPPRGLLFPGHHRHPPPHVPPPPGPYPPPPCPPFLRAPRLQMAAFLSRTVDAAARRSSRRLVLERLWFPVPRIGILGSSAPRLIKSDGADLWIAIFGDGSVIRMRASDFKYLETWTGA